MTTAAVPGRSGDVGRRRLLVAAVVLTAFDLRTAVSSIGPLLEEVRRDVGLSAGQAGLLTALPLLCFAAVGALAGRAARGAGSERVLAVALGLVSVGSAARAVADGPVPFLACSALAFAGVAVGNVLLPVIVKQHFPRRVGPMTAVYSTVLALGAGTAAAGSVPLAELAAAWGRTASGWRFGLGSWALPAAAAAVLWLLTRPHAASAGSTRAGHPALGTVTSRRLRWALAGFFGAQALQAFVVMGWFGEFFREAGAPARTAGYLLAVVAAVSVPVSLLVPWLAGRARSQRGLVVALTLVSALALAGLLTAPLAGAWWWALLLGVGTGNFPLALTLFGLRSATAAQTAALSVFAQSTGYVLAAAGPLLTGWLHGLAGWPPVFAVLAIALAVQLGTGLAAARPDPAPAGTAVGPAGCPTAARGSRAVV